MSTSTKRGGYRKTKFGELLKKDPERAACVLQEVWTKEGESSRAAKILDVSRSTFFRAVVRLDSLGFFITAPTSPTERHSKKPVSIPSDHGLRKSSGSDQIDLDTRPKLP